MNPPTFNPAWPEDVQALYRHDVREIWDRRIAPHIWNQYHNQLDLYLGLAATQPLQILDIGCAQGTLALLLAERGHHVTAVDIRPQFLEYARSRYSNGDIRFLAANALTDDLPGGQDLVFANQIVEHMVHPLKLLQRLRAMLKPGGRLVVTTPNGDYVKNSLPAYGELDNLADWEHLQFTADGDGHFFAYRPRELTQLFTSAGLQDVQVRCFETPFISGHMKLRLAHGFMPVFLLRAADRILQSTPLLGAKLSHQLLATGVNPGAPC